MFGATTTTQPTTLPSLFSQSGSTLGGTQALTATTPSLFGTSRASTTTTQSIGLLPSVGLTTSTTPSTGGFSSLGTTPGLSGFGGLQSTSSGVLFGSTTTTTTTTATPSAGLGGVDDLQSASGLTGTAPGGGKDVKAIKEAPLPVEITTSLEAFKKYVKDEKVIREEISRVSSKPILKVQEETIALKQLLLTVSSGLQRNAQAIEKLKQNSAEDLKHAEISQRTKDTPPALQYENVAPTEYFQNLALSFERQMQVYRQQIEQLECHLLSLSHPAVLTPQELTFTMRRLYETFVALAAQLQNVHEAVQCQKEDFLALRKQATGDSTNIFEMRKIGNLVSCNPRTPVTLGPDPFSGTPSAAAVAMASALNKNQQPSGSFQSTDFGTGTLGSSGSLAGSNSPFGSLPVQNKQFQLQKPPPGNKRGKRWTST